MKNRIKRICASLLAAMMVFTYMPAMAFAADTGSAEWFDNYTSFRYEGVEYGQDNIEFKQVDSTCTKEGSKTWTAKVNGQVVGTHEESIDMIPHDTEVVEKNRVEATCVEDGSYDEVTQCKVCKEVLKTEHKKIEKTGVHTNKEYTEVTKEATCKEDGSQDIVVKCSVCGLEVSRTTEVIPKGEAYHVWDEGKVTKEPTCHDDGEKTFTCTLCGKTKTEVTDDVKATGKHNFVEKLDVKEAATCTEEGSGVRSLVCDVCGEVKADSEEDVTIPATGHDWDEGKVTKEPTDPKSCEETGEKTFTCKNCKATKVEKFGAKEHTVKTTVVERKEPTCGTDGYVIKHSKCTVCGKDLGYERTDLPATGENHVWVYDESDVIAAPTCTEAGRIAAGDVWCDECKVSYKELNEGKDYYEIPALGHLT